MARSRSFSHVCGASMRRSSAKPFAAPRTRIIVPSVTMKGTTRRPVTRRPLTTPHSAAATTPASAASSGDHPAEQQCDHHGRQRDDRADRQIDAAGDDDRPSCRARRRRRLPSAGRSARGWQEKEARADQHAERHRDEQQAENWAAGPRRMRWHQARSRCPWPPASAVLSPIRRPAAARRVAAAHHRDAIAQTRAAPAGNC